MWIGQCVPMCVHVGLGGAETECKIKDEMARFTRDAGLGHITTVLENLGGSSLSIFEK